MRHSLAFLALALLGNLGTAAATPAQVGGRTWYSLLDFDESDNYRLEVAAIGDLDGDGSGDVALVEWDKIMVRSGRDGAALLQINHPAANFFLGAFVEGTGDVDGDGVPDLAVGFPGESTAAGATSGAIHIHSGRDGHEIRTLAVDLYTVKLGRVMANCGDLDGDGVEDLAAGVPLWWPSPPGGTGSGRVVVWSGRTGHVIWNLDPPDDVRGLGFDVAPADVDGDGVPDVAAAGGDAVCIYSGATGRLLDELHFEPNLGDITVVGGGDWTGDGRDELCIAFPFADGPLSADSGLVLVWSHALQGDVLQIHGPAAGSAAGSALAVGDVDGEPGPELLVGAPSWSTAPGLRQGAVAIHDIPDGTLLHLEAGVFSHQRFGSRLDTPGDTNGDGFADVLVADDSTYLNEPPHASIFGLAPFLAPLRAQVSRSAGGKLLFDLDFGWQHAFHAYRVLASAHGTGPGWFQGLEVPLTPDCLFAASARGELPAWAWDFDGVLDLEGRATAAAVPPPGALPAALVGRSLFLAAVAGPLPGPPIQASLPAAVAVEP